MSCPNCQTTNPEGARFCINCGAALSKPCSKCGTNLPSGARFCFSCGQPAPAQEPVSSKPAPIPQPGPATQVAVSATDFADLVQRYIPKELLNKLETARRAGILEGERRVVTILFCDVKGSTSAASNLDPEEWAEIINGAFEYMIRPVYAFEGTVARLMGDGLLAFFGAPIAHEDDPQRAVLAGLEILKTVKAYGDQIKTRWGLDFDVRVGINTGLVVVGAVGSDLRMEYTALGDAINLAARMEQTAQAGTVQIAEPTHKLIAPLFDFETIENLEVKGKDSPLRAYRVIRPKAIPGRTRGIEGLNSPLIGREAQISDLLAAVGALRDGSGQIVSLIGEAGLGKSRLIDELRLEASMDPSINIRWLEGRSLSYEVATPFAPFIHLFTNYFGLQSIMSDREKYERILAELDPLFPGTRSEFAPFFATMLGVEMEESDAERVIYLEPPHLRSLIFAHVANLVDRILAAQPLVLVLDDLHWSDPTSLELLSSLLPLADHAPLMVVAAFRPRRQEPAWRFHETAGRDYHHRYQAIELEPLDEIQSRQLVAGLLEIEDLPEKVRQLILEKSEGNPFFVEEIIRSLLDGGLVVRENGHWRATKEIVALSIPDTLAGVITARLDRLDEPARRALQAASIIGREFSSEVLSDLLDAPGLLTKMLPELLRRDLLKQRTRLPTPVYAFKHVLTQEAAYGSILLSNRRELHHMAAESLIDRSPDETAEIARHLLEARQPTQALPYLVAAGNKAARAYATAEAIDFFSKALELRDSAESLEPVRQAYEGLGRILTFANRIPEAQKIYEDMLALAETQQDIPMQISALNKLGSLFALSMGQFKEAEQFLVRSENMIRQFGEKSSFPELAIVRCQACTAQADFDNVVKYMGEVVEIGEEEGNPEHVIMGLEHVANSLAFMTRYDEALEKGLRALQVARELGDRLHEAALLTSAIPIANIRNGDFAAARGALSEGIQVAKRIQALIPQVEGGWMLAELALWQGEYEQALESGMLSLEAALPLEEFLPFELVLPLSSLGSIYLEISPRFTDKIAEFHRHALRLLETPVGAMTGGTAWADLGFCAMILGDMRLAEESIQKGLNYPTIFSFIERPRLLAGAALLALNKGGLDEASRLISEASAYAKERDMRHVGPLIALTAGKVQIARGQTEPGLKSFAEAENLAQALNMRPKVWEARAAAAETLAAAHRTEEARSKSAAARAMVEEIAGLFKDQDLREAYLKNALSRILP